ncbi:family 43 glycosylhydrolase [Saccharothrix hoggarensis]|uniref:Family 43 glycosylhydrolase n=1 Tax=Saccharothrix hoggarensis TaxID=913853 RepID=A0ABW3QSV1_9PSEU
MDTIAPPSSRRRIRPRVATAIMVVVAILVSLVQAIVAAAPASAAYIDTNATYILANRHSGKVLEVFNQGTANGAPIGQWARNNNAWQQWQFVDSGGGYYRLRSVHSGKVLDIAAASTADGANVALWTDHNGTNQQFRVSDSEGGHIRLINRNSGKALEVWGWSTADGGRVSQYTDLGGANQQWQLIRTGDRPPYPRPGLVTGDIGVHDPTVVKRSNGTYLLASTGDNIPLKTSNDRTDWRNAGSAFPGGVPWAHPYTNNSNQIWAPDLTYVNGRYYMYYSASSVGSSRSAIFLATSTTGAAGSWRHEGLIYESRTGENFNAIDPTLTIDTQGGWWLTLGSYYSGLKQFRLDPVTGKRADSTLINIASRNAPFPQLPIEAATLVRHGGYYYLFVSFDYCCRGAASDYRIMVGRSTSVNGPFTDRDGVSMMSGGGTEILAGRGNIHGPGHQEYLDDTDGSILFYHYYADNGNPLLGINKLGWDQNGWPYVY